MISVFTPCHNPTWLRGCYESLQQQTHKDWEWIIVPNGEQAPAVIELATMFANTDERVRIVPWTGENVGDKVGIGALKRFACDQATGELFLELDHDDKLTSDCMAQVAKAYEAADCGQPIFIWSEDVALEEDGSTCTFGAYWGWAQYKWVYKGKSYAINKAHDITPRSLCEILYCPDHVRVWNRKAYELAGGHDPELPFCDDHLLMIKTYLCGTEFIKLPRPTYIYHRRKNNTCVPNVDAIQALSRKHRDVYLRDLVHEWTRREGLKMYDLGGAHNCPDGYIAIDPHWQPDPKKPERTGLSKSVFEIEFEPNSVGVFRAHDFLEHIPAGQIPALMNKLYDALVPGGWILTQTPSVECPDGRVGRGAFQDPTHCSWWSTNNTWYYTNREQAQYVPEIACRFQSVVLGTFFPSEWHEQHHIPYMRWDACALKHENSYWPGPKLI